VIVDHEENWWGPTLELPHRGRTGDELTWLQRANRTAICHQCGHLLRRIGYEWRCDEGCRCMMMGCAPREGGWDE
jgi:hypothetical protein